MRQTSNPSMGQNSHGVCQFLVKMSPSNGWMDDLRFYALFNSISVISGRWVDDNEKLCAVELKRAPPHARLEAKTAIVISTELPGLTGPQEA